MELSELLESRGHQVMHFAMSHPRNRYSPNAKYFVSYINYPEMMSRMNLANGIKVINRAFYSREARAKLAKLIADTKPDIAHVHNIAFLLTPSIFYALADAGIPVVQTLHDFKLLCPATLFLRNGEVCDLCTGGKFYNAVRWRCKWGSLPASLIICLEAYLYRWLRTYHRKVDRFLAPSKFLRQKMVEAGMPAEKIIHLPNSINLERFKPSSIPGEYGLYIGRLSCEKGVQTLLKACALCPDMPFRIAGEGPLEADLRAYASENHLLNVEFVGYLAGEKLFEMIRKASFVVVPSECYDNSPLACYEAMSLGRPVIGAEIGGIPELVQDGETGLLFEPRNPDDLAEKMRLLNNRPDLRVVWGGNGRRMVETNYNPDDHYQTILAIYEELLLEGGNG
jgi:glycosyltransferase involved in cell wall biosynthesis